MDLSIDAKYENLKAIIASCDSAAVAFSGGVDSSFLCKAAKDALGDKAAAITIVSPMLPKSEVAAAKKVAAAIGIRHILLNEDEIEEVVAQNPSDRCYHCKKLEFGAIIDCAKKEGITTVLDGSNIDDEGDYRPGLRALSELKVRSPLREAGLSKDEIRALSKKFDLSTWNKPAVACLASRIPYGERINAEKLLAIETAEEFLREKGFVEFRLRAHGNIARIEVARDERKKFFNEALLDEVAEKLKSIGFLYAAFEAGGYKMGSLNAALR